VTGKRRIAERAGAEVVDGAGSRREFLMQMSAAAAAIAVAGMPAEAVAKGVPAPLEVSSPETAVRRLAEGNRRFVQGNLLAPGRSLARVKQVADKQTPFAAFLGCADSRVPIEVVFDQGFGDLFAVRVAGNVATSVEIASLEFGTEVLGAKLIMVLGHSNCGAVKAALQGKTVPGQISTLYQHIVPGIDRSQPDIDTAVKANVRYQALKLKEGSTVISSLIGQDKLKVVGGFYDLKSGKVTPVDV
jgi:carbonic anhydrase